MDLFNKILEIKLWMLLSTLLSATILASALTATMTAVVMSQQRYVVQAPQVMCPSCPRCELPIKSPPKHIQKGRKSDWVPSNDGKVY